MVKLKKRGSQIHLLRWIESSSFLTDINVMVSPVQTSISISDDWKPKGRAEPQEETLEDYLSKVKPDLSNQVRSWWLAHPNRKGSTPSWDLLSTCLINNQKGILLVEAKAHSNELKSNSCKSILKCKSKASKENHNNIINALFEVNNDIRKKYPSCNTTVDKCYQLSNRIAHAWWLANHGIPVVLMYLGFLNAEDVSDQGDLFRTEQDWQDCFINHAKHIGVDALIGQWVSCGDASFITIVKSIEVIH